MTRIIFELLTPRCLDRYEDGKLILSLWKQNLPNLLPDYFGNFEPIREKFDPENQDAALAAWRWPFLAVKRKPAVESSIWMRKGKQAIHASWGISIERHAVAQDALLNLLRKAATALGADFACVHLLTASEIQRGLANKTIQFISKQRTKFTFMIGSPKLQRRIPELYWATVFGSPYVDMFGRERILSAPVFRVESLGRGCVMLQLTPNIGDLESGSPELERTRSAAKSHLGSDAFFRVEAEASARYRVPPFALERTVSDREK